MKLIVAIPERWEGAGSPVAWALVRPDGTLASEGEGLIADLPSAKRSTVVISASRVLFAVARLPRRGARRIRGVLAYAIEDQLTGDPDTVHAVPAGAPCDGRQSIAAVDRSWLRATLGTFHSAGVSVSSVTVETCLVPLAPGAWTVVLRDQGGFVRTGEANGLVLDRASGESVPSVLRLALEAAHGEKPRKIVIRTDPPVDARAWERELGVPCDAAGPWRASEPVGPSAVEFLQGEFARTVGSGVFGPRLRPAALLAGAALAIEVLGTFCHWGALRYEKAQLEARMNQQFRAAFPQAQAIVDPALQMRRNLQTARAGAGVPQESDFLPLLARATSAESAARWKVRTVGYDAGRLTLDVTFADRAQADSMLKRLASKDVGVSLEAADPKSGEARFVFALRDGR